MAGGPFDYITPASQANPFGSAVQGFAVGNQIQQQQQAQQLAQQQAQAQLERQRQYQQDVAAVMQNPNAGAREFASLPLKYPEFKEAMKGSLDILSEDQRKNEVAFAGRTYSALNSGRKDLALGMLDDRIKAMENSGANPQDISGLRATRDTIDALPLEMARNTAGWYLATIADPKQSAEFFGKLGTETRAQQEQPFKQAKNVADIRNVESQIESRATNDELRKLETQIKVQETALKREDNDLKREELQIKLADAKDKRDQLKRTQEADASTAFGTVDRVLDTVDRISKHPGLSGAVGLRLGTAGIPGTDAADASALIEQLGSQGFLAEVDKMKGLGALTEAEGRKLTAAIGSLDKNQSEKQFRANLKDITSQFEAAKKRLETKYGVAAPTEPPVLQSKKYGAVTQKMIDNLAQQKGVSPDVARQFYEAN